MLRDLGYCFERLVLEPPRGNLRGIIRSLVPLANGRTLREVLAALGVGWRKMKALDAIEEGVLRLRPLQVRRGSLNQARRRAIEDIGSAETLVGVSLAAERALDRIRCVCGSEPRGERVCIGIVGAIFMMLEPGANRYVEEALGALGVEVVRTVRITAWARDNILLDYLRSHRRGRRVREAAAAYLAHFTGGNGRETLRQTALLSQEIDGVIHVMPFACLPKVVARSIMPAVVRDLETLVFDEHTARAGVMTRLEAFVDMIRRRQAGGRRRNNGSLSRD